MSFGVLQETDFFGRSEELSALLRHINAAVRGKGESVVLSGPAGIGKTQLLKQLFGHLFWKQDRIVPFYYSANPALLSAAAFSSDYLSRFLCQQLAFEKKEQALLSLDGISVDDLSALLEERGVIWAQEMLDNYLRSAQDPIRALSIALTAPRQAAIASGLPVAVLIDEFHRLKDLHIDGNSDQRLVSLFEAPLSFGKTPHIITGNPTEIHEMPAVNTLQRISLPPLGPEDDSSKAGSLLRSYECEGDGPPPLLLRHLGGNPFYLSCLMKRACAKKNPGANDYWKAYAAEITGGGLSLRWAAILKRFFPDLAERSRALNVAYKICHAREALSCKRIAKTFILTEDRAERITHGLYLAGFIRGEFGLFRPVEDRIVLDVVDYLYLREALGKPGHELEQTFLEKSLPQQDQAVRFEMTLPMAKEVELVAAQCLEQIGKNLQVNRDAVGQMQIAVIEACINAIEHSKGGDNNIYLSFTVEGDRFEVSIESSGQEFIMHETGEPFQDKKGAKAPGRGWGIKLMKRFVDEVRFEKTARGTKTVLIKKITKTAGVQKENSIDRE